MALKSLRRFYGTCRGGGQGTESWRRGRRLMSIQINNKIKNPVNGPVGIDYRGLVHFLSAVAPSHITVKKQSRPARLLLFPPAAPQSFQLSSTLCHSAQPLTSTTIHRLSSPSNIFSPVPPTSAAIAPLIQSRPGDSFFTLLPYTMSPPSGNVTLAVSAPTSTTRASFPTQNDRERSRNAKAQARHRAKRKAYVEQVYPIPRSIASAYTSVLNSLP